MRKDKYQATVLDSIGYIILILLTIGSISAYADFAKIPFIQSILQILVCLFSMCLIRIRRVSLVRKKLLKSKNKEMLKAS